MSNINIAEKIIVQALAADPRTANIRVSRNRNMIMLSEEVDADTLENVTQEDVSSGNAPAGTKISVVWDRRWQGKVIEARRTNYVVERTRSRSGRGAPGKRFTVRFTAAVLI